ncbi:hypothetical protein OCA10_29730 [Bacillus cereus]|nr:hypothetical protein [Bacillus cereus]
MDELKQKSKEELECRMLWLIRVNERESTPQDEYKQNAEEIRALEHELQMRTPRHKDDWNNGYYEYIAIQSQAPPNKLFRG